jgi:transposase
MKLEEQLNYKLFIGIDVSKKTIDSAIVNDFGKKIGHKKFANNQFGFDSCLEWLREFYQDGQVVFCLEHTGIYSRLLSMFLQDEGFSVCMESGYVIKHSGGILKGKNDKIDAYRIAEYALSNKYKLKISEHYDLNIIKLHDLMTTRNRLVVDLKRLTTPINEMKEHGGKESYEMLLKACKAAIDGIKKSIMEIEQMIDELIEEVEGWKERMELVTSVKGIGKIVGLWMMVYTKNFKSKINARQFASLVGIAPFEESSGSSVRKGTHVSNHAHKFLKGILHSAAMSAIKSSSKIKEYHKKKKKEGKKGFVVMNNIKNKLVQIVFSVVRTGIQYDEYFQYKKVA